MENEKIQLLCTAGEYSEKLAAQIAMTVDLFRSAREQEAFRHMMEMIDAIQRLVEAIEVVNDLLTSPINTGVLNEYLEEMTLAFENSDFVLLADLLEYEISPIMEEWNRVIVNSIAE